MSSAILTIAGLLVGVLLIGLWRRTVRALVGQLLHIVLDPVDAAIRAMVDWQETLSASLRTTSESHGWSRTTVPTETVLGVLMTAALGALALSEFEMWLGSFPVAFGGEVLMPFGITFNPGMSAAYAALAATFVFGLKFYHLNWQRRRAGRMTWTLAGRMAASLPLLATVAAIALVGAQYRTTTLAAQRLEEAQVTALPGGFQAGAAATAADDSQEVVESSAVSAERAALQATADEQIYRLNLGITAVVLLAGGYALHGAMNLAMLAIAALMFMARGGLWLMQFALHGFHLALHGIAAGVDWVARVAGLCILPLASRLPDKCRELTDLDGDTASPRALESSSAGPADERATTREAADNGADDDVDGHDDETREPASEQVLYDPFGGKSDATKD
jgi:hypothetical protein